MARISFSMPERLKDWACERVAEGRHVSLSDYIGDFMRRDQEKKAKLRRFQPASTSPPPSGLYRMSYIAAKDIVTFSEARANLSAVMDRACADRAPVVVKRARGQENVVIVPQGEWDGMQETMHLLASPANAKRLMEGIARLDAGEGEEHELILL